MRFLYDTDHVSILEQPFGAAYRTLAGRIALHHPTDFAISIVTFDEQAVGAHAYLNRAKTPAGVIKGYSLLERVIMTFKDAQILPYDVAAAAVFARLHGQGVRIATNDLRIAAIALARNLTLLTRNAVHFSKVPDLVIEDWTA